MALFVNPCESRERPIIKSGTEILGGVLLTRTGIAVDTDENPTVYRSVLDEVDEKMERAEDQSAHTLLQAVDCVVKRRISYDLRTYRKILKTNAEDLGVQHLTPYHQIGLSEFIYAGVGICHQYSLLAGVVLRQLQERGDLGGRVSLESGCPNPDHPDRHTMVTFTEDDQSFALQINASVAALLKSYLKIKAR